MEVLTVSVPGMFTHSDTRKMDVSDTMVLSSNDFEDKKVYRRRI